MRGEVRDNEMGREGREGEETEGRGRVGEGV